MDGAARKSGAPRPTVVGKEHHDRDEPDDQGRVLGYDGTLIDSEPYWHEGEMKIAAAHGGYWDEELAWQGSGTPVPDVARRMVEHGCQLSIEEIGQGMIDYVAQKEFERIPWIEGVEDVLVALRDAGVPSMLVTTSPRHLAENLVVQAPAGAFAGYVCGDDDVEKKRLRPRIWRRVVAWASLRKI